MTEKQYFAQLKEINNSIHEDISSEQIQKIKEEIEKLKEFKPVRLELFLQEVRIASIDGIHKDSEVYEMLYGKNSLEDCYKGSREMLTFFRDFAQKAGNISESERLQYYIDVIEDKKKVDKYKCDKKLAELHEEEFAEILIKLYAQNERIAFLVLQKYMDMSKIDTPVNVRHDNLIDESNMGFLQESLVSKEDDIWVLVWDENNLLSLTVIEYVLKEMGKKLIKINPPRQINQQNLSEKDLMTLSLEHLEKDDDGVMCFTPFMSQNQSGTCTSLFYLMVYIKQKYATKELFHVFASGSTMDFMASSGMGKREMFRLASRVSELLEDSVSYGVYGNYLEYISRIYYLDCRKRIEEKSKLKFSIVIPARNSSATLIHTVKTCLNQRYTGEYEIVISDNSTDGNNSVREMVEEVNDSHVVYVKTPRNLSLPRSFEFAILQAQGEYILPLGSDDGLLPWTLEVLDIITAQNPDEEILQWERGFYAWPGFNGGQQNQFTIPRKYEKGKMKAEFIKATDYLDAIMQAPSAMYSLPLLYINSCFRRSYFKTLLSRTGCLWNGICQDLYMGIVTAATHPEIMLLQYPLSIAGMSSSSEGARANKGSQNEKECQKTINYYLATGNAGAYCKTWYELLSPDTGSDVSSLYLSLLRALSIGLLPEQYLDTYFDFKKMFLNICMKLDVRDVTYDRKINEIRFAAMRHGEEFLKWFDENIYSQAFAPRKVEPKKHDEKMYKTGTDAAGGQTLDASEYGVTNIYEASLLFAERTGL